MSEYARVEEKEDGKFYVMPRTSWPFLQGYARRSEAENIRIVLMTAYVAGENRVKSELRDLINVSERQSDW